MRILILPFGESGWKQKSRIVEEIISSCVQPPFVYNDVLILVASSRLVRFYGRLFLDAAERLHGTAAIVQPDIQTLHQFLQKRFARVSGPRLIDENSRLVLLEGLVKERLAGTRLFHQSPDLLAPSLSAVLAKMIEQLSTAEISPAELVETVKETEFSGKPQVVLLTEVYTRYKRALAESGLTDPPGMQSFLRDHFDPAWLSPYRRVIIDGIPPGSRQEAEILKKTADASRDCICLIDAPSKDLVQRAPEFHPLVIVKDFVASIGNDPIEAGTAGADDDYMASALFSNRSYSELAENSADSASFSKNISMLSAINMREEVSLIAGEVKKSLREGTPPDSILVGFPALDEYAALTEEIFTDYGIPYNRALGRQLSSSPVAAAIISLLRSCQEDYSGPSLLRVFSSPFLKFGEEHSISPALDRIMREQSIPGGKQSLLSALKRQNGQNRESGLTGPLTELFTTLDPFSAPEPAPLSVWMERLARLISWSEMPARVSRIRGALNVNLQAYKKMEEVISSLARAGMIFPAYRYTFNEWLFLLKKTFMHSRFQVPPEDEGGVQIMGLEESLCLPWKEIYLGGLVDGKFPQRLPQNIFLPEQTLEAMGVRTLEQARLNASYHFYRLLLSAVKIMLTWPENQGDRAASPSPFLEELAPLKKAGLLNRGREITSGIQFSLKIEDSQSIPELAKAASMELIAGNDCIGLMEGLDRVPDRSPALVSKINAVTTALRHAPAQKNPAFAPLAKSRFSVTELDAYLGCPYDYYIINVLRIEPLEEVSEDISPMDRGSKVHSVLRNFYLSWNSPVTMENREEARMLLRKLADSAFDNEADTFRNRREKELFLNVMSERFLDAEIEFWKQGMKPHCLEQKIEGYVLELSGGRRVELSAKIDRIDVDENGNFIIVDYKTGSYPLPKMGTDQSIFQLPVYAVMALGLSGRLRTPIGLAYYDLSGKNGGSARDVVLFNNAARSDHPSSKPRASAKDAGEFEAILMHSMEKARKSVEAILAGGFAPAPQDENKCRYCENEMMCEKKDENGA